MTKRRFGMPAAPYFAFIGYVIGIPLGVMLGGVLGSRDLIEGWPLLWGPLIGALFGFAFGFFLAKVRPFVYCSTIGVLFCPVWFYLVFQLDAFTHFKRYPITVIFATPIAWMFDNISPSILLLSTALCGLSIGLILERIGARS